VTQFQYLTWDSLDTPSPPTPLLEFRRSVCVNNHRHYYMEWY